MLMTNVYWDMEFYWSGWYNIGTHIRLWL